MYTSPNW